MPHRDTARCLALTLGLASLPLASTAHANDKPAAVQVCIEGLPADVPLFVDAPKRNYRAMGTAWVLDFDLTLDGQTPEKFTRSGGNCLRAWLPARAVSEVRIAFDRTDTNLRPTDKHVKLKLKPDLWDDAGKLEIGRGAWSRFTTALPGTVELERLEPNGARKMEKLDALPAGRYRLSHTFPAATKGACTIRVVAQASGTITAENHPAELAALVKRYETEIAPSVLTQNKESCAANEHVEMRVVIQDGVYRNARNPTFQKTAEPLPPYGYVLEQEGKALPFTNSGQFDIGFGERFELK